MGSAHLTAVHLLGSIMSTWHYTLVFGNNNSNVHRHIAQTRWVAYVKKVEVIWELSQIKHFIHVIAESDCSKLCIHWPNVKLLSDIASKQKLLLVVSSSNGAWGIKYKYDVGLLAAGTMSCSGTHVYKVIDFILNVILHAIMLMEFIMVLYDSNDENTMYRLIA